ncbi:hypothetical protein Tco_1533115 [Tanacetum coccineum]
MLAPEDIKKWINTKAEAVQIIRTGIDNDIYSTINACPNSMEMWKAIERLKQCESINVQDLKTNLYWEFEKFTSQDGESLNSPEWQRFVTLVKQREQLKTISYHKLYDILKQYQNEVNEIRAERQERTTNPLTLISQQKLVYYPQPNTTYYTQSSSTRSQVATKNRDKAIANSPPLTYDPEPKVVADDDASLKEKEIDKLMALISMSFKKIYKPTSYNLISSSNTRNTNVDNTPRSNSQTGRYDNQRAVNVVRARENVGTQGTRFRLSQKKMLLCKQEEARIQLSAEQANCIDNLDDEPKDQELEAHYMYMEKIQEVTLDAADNSGHIFDVEPLQKVHNNDDDYNVYSNDRQHLEQPELVNDTYLVEQCDTIITSDLSYMSNNREEADQDDQML